MRLEIGIQQKLEQRLKLAPQIIQSIEILQLPLLELDRLIKAELEENPVLEMVDPDPEDGAPAPEAPAREEEGGEYAKLVELENDWQEFFQQSRTPKSSDEKDKKFEAMQNTAARPISLQDYLFQQFNLLEVTEPERAIGEKIIFNINNDGYLQYPLEEILDIGQDPEKAAEAERVLARVQDLEPQGIGGRDMVEILLLQIPPGDSSFALKERLIRNHLEDVRKNRLPKIARDMGMSLDQVKDLVSEISILNPRPGALYSTESPQYIIPDIIVDLVDGEYVIRLEDRYVPSLRISNIYRRLLKDKAHDASTRDFIKKKIESARWLIDSIEQRQNTLFRVAVEIFKHQKAFLEHGVAHLKPLKMQTIADDVGIHVSTVSRAIFEKYAQTHRGIFPLKYFFSGGTVSDEGEDLSRVTVKTKVKEIIDQEPKKNPLSDEDIVEELKKRGLNIARRTVTKYRKMLGIPSSRQRKEY